MKWTIGNIEIFQIIELEAGKIIQSIMPDATPDNIKKMNWLYPNYADKHGNLNALVQSFLIKSNDKYILVDTCNGNNKNRPSMLEWANLRTKFIEKLREVEVTPDDINFVVCTHLHFDHVGWNTILVNEKWIPTFSNAKYIFSKKEYEYWNSKPKKELIDDLLGIEDSIQPIINAGLAELVNDDYKIDKNISLVPTPGHTPHHVSVDIQSQGKKALISGDLIYHPCQVEKPEWGNTVDTFPDQALETRKELISLLTDSGTLLLGSHFSNPVGGYVKTKNGKQIFSSSI